MPEVDWIIGYDGWISRGGAKKSIEHLTQLKSPSGIFPRKLGQQRKADSTS